MAPRGSKFFDASWYLGFYSDVAIDGISPFEHYITHGAKEGRDPSADFSTTAYNYLYDVPLEDCLADFEHRRSILEEFNINIIHGLVSNTGESIAFFFHQSGFQFFGAELSFLNEIKSHCEDGCDVTVFLPKIGSVEYVEILRKYAGRVIVSPYGWLNTPSDTEEKCINRLRYFLRILRPSKVFINTSVVYTPIAAAKFHDIPTRIYVHELLPEDESLCQKIKRTPEQVKSSILSDVDEVVPNSFKVASWLQNGNIKFIQYPAVEAGLFSISLNELQLTGADELKVSIISDNSPKKGLNDFIGLARFFEYEDQNIIFQIFGPQVTTIENSTSDLNNIEHFGYVEDVCDIYSNSDIILNLSKCGESFGRTILEGMAAGRVCIAYDRGAMQEVIGSTNCGYLITPDDLSEVIDILKDIYDDRHKAISIGRKARQRARKINGQTFSY